PAGDPAHASRPPCCDRGAARCARRRPRHLAAAARALLRLALRRAEGALRHSRRQVAPPRRVSESWFVSYLSIVIPAERLQAREHDLEKWVAVFGKDYAPPIGEGVMTIRRKVITL